MHLFIEKYYPVMGGIATACAYLLLLQHLPLPGEVQGIFPILIIVSAIVIGFLLTANAILLAVQEKRIVQKIKEIGLFDTLINYFLTAIAFTAMLGGLSILGALFNLSGAHAWHYAVLAVIMFIATAAVLSAYRVIHMLLKILRAV